MAKYRKKPLEVEAIQFNGNITEILDFCNAEVTYDREKIVYVCGGTVYRETLTIHTREGYMTANKGYYIIKGTQGKFYVCNPETFKETYEKVEEQQSEQ
jgi:hypothetical protein